MTQRFQLQFEVRITLPLVRGLLMDLRAFGDLHPLIEHVEAKGQGRYVVHEFKPLLLGQRLRFRYDATVYVEDNAIVYDSTPAGLRILSRFTLVPVSENLTRVIEEIELSGFPLFLPLLKKAISATHPRLFQAMARPGNNG